MNADLALVEIRIHELKFSEISVPILINSKLNAGMTINLHE